MLSQEERSKIGYKIREENSGKNELSLCEKYELKQIGGSKTKVDGTNGIDNYSIKNMGGSSTQVHITTQKSFLNNFNASTKVCKFVEMFCGTQELFDSGIDRYTPKEIEKNHRDVYEEFVDFLEKNKTQTINYIVSGNSDITHILVKDKNTNEEFVITTKELYEKIQDCTWHFLEGGIHLKNKDGKTLFHFQREGKKGGNPNKIKGIKFNNRFNVLWHIHKNVFI
jgi:hypothetical protein